MVVRIETEKISNIHKQTNKQPDSNCFLSDLSKLIDRQAIMLCMKTYHSIGSLASRVVIKGCCNLVGGKLMSSFLADSTTQSAL